MYICELAHSHFLFLRTLGKQVYSGGGIYCGKLCLASVPKCMCTCTQPSSNHTVTIIAASKHAVDAISRTLLLELVDTPIRVSQINPGLVNTEFSTIRFGGDSSKADAVYKGLQPLVGQDVGENGELGLWAPCMSICTNPCLTLAEIVTFAASRPPHVNIADVLGKPKPPLTTCLLLHVLNCCSLVFPTAQADARTTHRE